ncbi:MAG: hypothetical protein U0325_09335 [Polyangiales bacterium]
MRLWLLNLDAEEELSRGAATTPSRDERARIQALSARLRGTLVPAGDATPDDPDVPRGVVGLAWCPTPAALARLARLGARLPACPDFSVLRAVNHRRWAAARGLALPGARWVDDGVGLARLLDAPWPAQGWLLKRAYTFAGRGHLHLRDRAERDDPRVQGWLRRSLAQGGLLAEPRVTRVVDVARHGWLARDGALTAGALTRAEVDERGQWVASARCEDDRLSRSEIDAFDEVFRDTAGGLRAAGYFGPFGVDGFVWTEDGARRLQPRSDVNARYAMGWAVGMGASRPDLAAA